MRRSGAVVAAVVLGAGLLGGCSGAETDTGGTKGFVSGDGRVATTAVDDRTAVPAGQVAGATLEGQDLSLEDLRGQVVVVNVWGSWCAPCRAEAPDLVAAYEELDAGEPGGDAPVTFLGINTRDTDPAPALAFERTYDIPYPSLYDQGGTTLLAFDLPVVVPSTVVVDAQGRVAVTIIGELPSTQTLVDVVSDVRDSADSTGAAADPADSGA